jgi:Domain of unknown function (DUF4852)
MKMLAVTGLCLAIMVGFASAQSAIRKTAQTSPSSAAKSPSHSQSVSAHPITDEEAFFYHAAISGAGDDLAKAYAIQFDAANFNHAMANEFLRAQYMRRMQARVEAELKRVDFSRKFTALGRWSLGEYSFSSHSFPVFPPTGNVVGPYPFVAEVQHAVNKGNFDWALPMSEADASAFVRSRTAAGGGQVDRTVITRLTYSILNSKGPTVVFGGGPVFITYIHSMELFSDQSMARKLGTLKRRPGIPENAYAPDVAQAARSTTKIIGKYQYTAYCKEEYKCVTPVAGTITLTEGGIALSGEHRDGSTKPIGYSFLDALALNPNNLWRDNFTNITWGGSDFRVVWQPLWNVDFESELVFADFRERDRFFVDLTNAIRDWTTKYPQFVANGFQVYQLCGDPGGHFNPCPGTPPNDASQ